jgi:glycosyltransferase involved in cell wall biosynthesis
VYPGFIENADLAALYSGARLFVMPSLHEGFCMPVLEAMACGAPVVCSNASSLPEVAGDAALLFDPLDVEAMAAAIERALGSEELRRKMARRGSERVKAFTWARCARQVLTVLECV